MKAVLLLSFFGGVFLQKGPTPGPPVPPPTCSSPKEITVEKLEDAGLKGIYPKTEIMRAMRSTPGILSGFSAARRDILCDCYRKKPKPSIAAKDFNNATAAEKGKPGVPFLLYTDTCPVTHHVFTFPNSQMFLGKKCWILKPWAGLKCPHRSCRYRSCRGVKAKVGTGFTICRPTNLKCKAYYIWCPELLKVFKRYKCFHHCCSCMLLQCVWPGRG